MLVREYGALGISVGVLGLGAGHLGDPGLAGAEVERLLNRAVDAGVTLIDTARGYGLSEERIGRYLAHRRADYVLSTKVGYGIDGVPDWTGGCITAGIERACSIMRTDHLDIVHLHSCGRAELERGEVTEALERAKAAGKVRAIAYSGDNEALDYAITSGSFDGIECSLNICDQRVLKGGLAAAGARNMGVIVKRPLANAPWRYLMRPVGAYVEQYWQRLRAMGLEPRPLGWPEFALRFAAFQPGVTSCIVGSTQVGRSEENLVALRAGPLPPEQESTIKQAFAACDQGWEGLT